MQRFIKLFILFMTYKQSLAGNIQSNETDSAALTKNDSQVQVEYIASLPRDADKHDIQTQILLRRFEAYLTSTGEIKPLVAKIVTSSKWIGDIPHNLYLQNETLKSSNKLQPVIVDVID